MQADPALEYIAEFLPFMGLMLKELLSGFQVHQQGLHLVLLGGRHDPLDTVAGFIDLLEKAFVGENDLLRLRFLKKSGGSGPQAFDQIQQGHDRGGDQAVLQLGYVTFGQFRTVSQLLLGQPVHVPELPDSFSNILRDLFSFHKISVYKNLRKNQI